MSEPPVFAYNVSANYGSVKVLDAVQGSLKLGEIVSLVGLSGSGKTTLSMALLQLLHYRGGTVSGSIQLKGRELAGLPNSELRKVRGRELGYVPQSPTAALNPRLRIQTLLDETWNAHSQQKPALGFYESLLESVSLPSTPAFRKKYSGSLSVGQGQRLLIALGIMHKPAVLLADEPTSALDVITQAQVLRLLSRLATDSNMAMLFISHDLQAVASFSSRVEILHQGRIVETGAPANIFRHPVHPFTQELVRSLPAAF